MVPILFEKDATAFTSRGLYPLSDAISCTVTEERNGEYELEMLYPITGAHFSEITEDRIIAVIPHYGGTKQGFRIYRREAELNGEVIFRARHISYQLNFIPVDIVSGQTDSAQTMMEDIAAAAQTTQPFSFWSDVTAQSALDWAVYMPCGLRSALGGQEGSVLDKFGGEFEWDNWTVKLHESRGQDNGVRITYGKNLTELSDVLDIGETITGVMAFYQADGGNGQIVTVYTSPKVITNGQGAFAHGRIVTLDMSGDFEQQPTQLELTDAATAWLARTESVDPVSELTVSFIPLGQTPEYSYDPGLDRVNLCDLVTVRYPALGLSVKKKITRAVWNVLSGMYDEVTIGDPETTLADTIVDIESSGAMVPSSSGGGSDTGWVDCKKSGVGGTLEYRVKDGVLYISGDSVSYTAAANAATVVGRLPFTVSNYLNYFARSRQVVLQAWIDLTGDIYLASSTANPNAIAMFYAAPID